MFICVFVPHFRQISNAATNNGYATVSSQLLNLPCYSIHALYHGHGKTGHASLDHLNPIGYIINT
jgi:hypothetical protein